MNEYILQTKELTKVFKGQTAVDHISLSVRAGSVYGLLGPNGAGKSTTLKLIVGLMRPTEGEILFCGQRWRRNCLDDIGVLIESPALYGNLTARENLRVHTRLLRLPEERISKVLQTVELTNTGRKKTSQFSLGMKQRLGIAIALLNHPKLLILDEPTNGLDPIGIQELRELVRSFAKQGMTVIVSSHILSEVEQIADDIGIISDGRLRYEHAIGHDKNLEELFIRVIQENRKEECI